VFTALGASHRGATIPPELASSKPILVETTSILEHERNLFTPFIGLTGERVYDIDGMDQGEAGMLDVDSPPVGKVEFEFLKVLVTSTD
jgi:hypothetical protein